MATHNPYVGPRPFTEEEERFFFGRTEEVEILTSLVVTRRASLLFAQSGAGKSSLLMAGLTPRLLRHRRIVRNKELVERLVSGIGIARVGKGHPELQPANVFVYSVATSLAPTTGATIPADITLEQVVSGLLTPGTPDDPNASSRPFLLIFDQFEELFTRHLARRDDRITFFQQVSAALSNHDGLRVLFSMREDYIAELTPFAHLLPDHLRPRFRLERLGFTAALDAVRKPAQLAVTPHPFADGVAEALCSNLQAGTGGDLEAILLQVVCKRLWNDLPDDRATITSDDLTRGGDVDVALRAYYDEIVTRVVNKLPTGPTAVSERRLRRFFTQQLLTPSHTRALVFRDDRSGQTGGLPNAAIDELSESDVNIVRSEVRSGGRWYELSHDRLIAPVVASNEAWEQAHVTPLQARAQEWSRTRRDEDLLTPMELLTIATTLTGPNLDPLTPLEDEYLARSRQMGATASASLRVNIGEVGWGVIFADDDQDREAIAGALAPLFEHRRAQTSERFTRFEFEVTRQETAQSFLARHGAATRLGTSAEAMPYYLLIVGSPERISFEFQYALDVQYAVGRIHFEGASAEETRLMYARYARSVVEAESGTWALRRDAVIFNSVPERDHASAFVHAQLATPLYDEMRRTGDEYGGWETTPVFKEVATRDKLLRLLGGSHRPTLLVAIGHGLEFREGEQQFDDQGALLCSDFTFGEPLTGSMYVAARDIDDSATLLGMIVFMAVPYGAGTPKYSTPRNGERRQIAPRAFVSRLAQRLLSHPNGAALAVIGNVDMFWASIFEQFEQGEGERRWRSEGSTTWVNAVSRLLRGHTAGSATEPFNTRYMQVASELVESILSGASVTARATERLMLEAVSVRNYIVIGDPAVRLPVDGPIAEQRPTIHVDASATARVEPAPTSAPSVFDMRLTRAIVAPPRATFKKRHAQTPPPDLGASDSEPAETRESRAVFNGVEASGQYAYAPMPLEAFAQLALGRSPEASRRPETSYLTEGASYFERPSSAS